MIRASSADVGEDSGLLQSRIKALAKQMNAVIVSHNYQRPEVQDVADFVGDSLELARRCAQTEAEIIVFCGVTFMAENAVILNPSRQVLLAEGTAGCPMADMIDDVDVREWRERYPGAAVVAYVNTTAAVKAESDICCTSANAPRVVNSVADDEIIFVPDGNLARWVAGQTTKKIIPYPGFCITHRRLTPEHVRRSRQLHPGAPVVVHPECLPEVADLADAVLSTSQMVRYCRDSFADTLLIGTEMGLLHRLQKECPGKTFFVLSPGLVCPNMKRTRLGGVLRTMEERRNQVTIPEVVRVKAQQALEHMLEVA
ncbi:MAG: quinolinate synthase NadA [Dehalococcoidia bacterium]|nr:quinolinate synthase NadA [Dehalococcoidia bacterium]